MGVTESGGETEERGEPVEIRAATVFKLKFKIALSNAIWRWQIVAWLGTLRGAELAAPRVD